MQADDKAKGAVGEPGEGVAFLQRQRRRASVGSHSAGGAAGGGGGGATAGRDTRPWVNPARASAHDMGTKVTVVPTVILDVAFTDNPDGSLHRGNVYVI